VIGHDVFPVEPWGLRERRLDLGLLNETESVFALANGHLGLRGNLDEGEPRGHSGTYLGGFYESYPLSYGEKGYGFPEDGQAVVDVTDGKIIRILVEDEPLDVHRGRLEEHERHLDFRTGVLERTMKWTSEAGRCVRVRSRRMVSFAHRSVAVIRYEIESGDGEPVRVAVQSNLLANQRQQQRANDDPRTAAQLGAVLEGRLSTQHDLRVVLAHTTRASQLSLAAGMDHTVEVDDHPTTLTQIDEDLGRVTISARLEPGKPLVLTKFLAYHWSSQQSVEWLRDQVDASLESAMAEGFDGLVASQRRILDDWWEVGDVELDGDEEVQQGLRYALFQLLQAGARAERQPIPAKGLTGAGYDGHAFWDTEGYVLPVLTYTRPRLVRDALRWRHDTLPQARERARQLGLRGAAFPWRTIHGEECSGYWPAGTAAFHVNAGIADAVRRYGNATQDETFDREVGVELLVETARLWASLGHHGPDGSFRIDGVTGPDEYSAIVDDNVYTNLMAQQNLLVAAEATERHPDVARGLGVRHDEIAAWRTAAHAMHVPFDERLGIHPQDQDFLQHARWDFDATPPDAYPLLLSHPYFALYRTQVVKQADLVLAMFRRGDAFTPEQKRRNFEYYEGVTVRDSSLSASVQAVMAAEVGHLELAHDYLAEAALTDLRDLRGDVGNGVHVASLAGALTAVVNGFGGLRDHGHHLEFRPRLPEHLPRLRFPIVWRGRRLVVEVRPGEVVYTLDPVAGADGTGDGDDRSDGPGDAGTDGSAGGSAAADDGIEIAHWGETFTVRAGQEERRAIPAPPDGLRRPLQPHGREPRRRLDELRGGVPTPRT
jgi:alpha,alpha-trehalose phosphorylase